MTNAAESTTDHRRRLPSGLVGGLLAQGVSIIGLSAGSTMVKASGSAGSVVAFYRLAIASVVWQVVVFASGKRFDRKAVRASALAGLLFGLNLTLFFTGVTKTRIAHSEFIGTLTPLFVVPIAARRLRERVPRSILLFGGLALCGVALIILTKGTAGHGVAKAHLAGDLMCLTAITLWAGYLLVTKRARQELGTPLFMAGMSTTATFVVLPFALTTHRFTEVSTKGWVLIAAMAVVSGIVSHGLLAWAQHVLPVSTITMMQLAQPGLAVVWAWTFLDEGIKPVQAIGMVVVLFAVGNIARITARQR